MAAPRKAHCAKRLGWPEAGNTRRTVIDTSELKAADRQEMMDRLRDQCERLQALLAREGAKGERARRAD